MAIGLSKVIPKSLFWSQKKINDNKGNVLFIQLLLNMDIRLSERIFSLVKTYYKKRLKFQFNSIKWISPVDLFNKLNILMFFKLKRSNTYNKIKLILSWINTPNTKIEIVCCCWYICCKCIATTSSTSSYNFWCRWTWIFICCRCINQSLLIEE